MLKTLVSQEIFASMGLRNKICFKISRIFNLKNVISIFTQILSMLPWGFLQHFYDLYNKNVLDLEYAQIARSGPKSMIRDIEGLSND